MSTTSSSEDYIEENPPEQESSKIINTDAGIVNKTNTNHSNQIKKSIMTFIWKINYVKCATN